MDTFDRWCLFCDFEIHSSHPKAKPPFLDDYVDDLIHLAAHDEAKRVFEHDSRVTRISHGRREILPDGSPALSMVITLGNKRGADPAFLHFDGGTARAPEKEDGEVKGYSAHCVIRLTSDDDAPQRYRMFLEEVKGIGRTPVTRLLGAVLKSISEQRGERFKNPDTGRMNAFRPVVEVHPRRSKEMAEAIDEGGFLPVVLLDRRPVRAFDEHPEFSVRQNFLSVKVKPARGRSIRDAVNDLKDLAFANGYDHMRLSWRLPGEKKGGTTEFRTDLADVGTAMFAHRELVNIPNGLSECSDKLCDDFVTGMLEKFV